jgi:hypothetical protein
MTNTQLLLLAGTVYIAPHVPKHIGLVVGSIVMIVAFLHGNAFI